MPDGIEGIPWIYLMMFGIKEWNNSKLFHIQVKLVAMMVVPLQVISSL